VEFHRVTNFTDSIWWKPWNFKGSQILLTLFGPPDIRSKTVGGGGRNAFFRPAHGLVEVVECGCHGLHGPFHGSEKSLILEVTFDTYITSNMRGNVVLPGGGKNGFQRWP
jgi:hypothetical protein